MDSNCGNSLNYDFGYNNWFELNAYWKIAIQLFINGYLLQIFKMYEEKM